MRLIQYTNKRYDFSNEIHRESYLGKSSPNQNKKFLFSTIWDFFFILTLSLVFENSLNFFVEGHLYSIIVSKQMVQLSSPSVFFSIFNLTLLFYYSFMFFAYQGKSWGMIINSVYVHNHQSEGQIKIIDSLKLASFQLMHVYTIGLLFCVQPLLKSNKGILEIISQYSIKEDHYSFWFQYLQNNSFESVVITKPSPPSGCPVLDSYFENEKKAA